MTACEGAITDFCLRRRRSGASPSRRVWGKWEEDGCERGGAPLKQKREPIQVNWWNRRVCDAPKTFLKLEIMMKKKKKKMEEGVAEPD